MPVEALRLRPAHQRPQNVLAGAEGSDPPVAQHGDLVDRAQHARLMGDDDHGALPRPQAVQRRLQGQLAGTVEIGVGLVEHDQRRLAEQRPGEAQPLLLPAGEPDPAGPDRRVVALRQAEDHLVHIGEARGLDHRGLVDLAHARDVLGDGAGEQHHLLRQVADMTTERVRIPGGDVSAVEADMAAGRLPGADDQPAERGLAGARRADDPTGLAGGELEIDLGERRLLRAARLVASLLELQPARRRRQRQARCGRLQGVEQGVQVGTRTSRRDEAAPGTERPLDRREGPAQDDRGGDHAAAGELAAEHQPGAAAEDQDLQGQAQGPGGVEQPVGDGARALHQPADALLLGLPAAQQRAGHAERPHGLGLVQTLLGGALVAPLRGPGALLPAAGDEVVGQGEQEERHRAEQRHPAEHRVHQPDDEDEDRDEGRIEKGEHGIAREKALDVAHVGEARRAAAIGQSGTDPGAEHRSRQLLLEPVAGETEHAAPRELEEAIRRRRQNGSDGQPEERVERAAGEHAVEHLQHVDGTDQQQQVGAEAEQGEGATLAPQLPLACRKQGLSRQRCTPAVGRPHRQVSSGMVTVVPGAKPG